MIRLLTNRLLATAVCAVASVLGSASLVAQTSDAASPLYLANTASKPGQELRLTVCLDNADYVVRGIEMDVTLPASVLFVEDSEDASAYAYSTTTRSSALNVTHYTPAGAEPNVSKVMIYPKPSKPRTIAAGSGAILELPVSIPAALPDGFYTIDVSNIVISLANGAYRRYGHAPASLTVSSYDIGDADTNGTVNGHDAAVVGEYILGTSPAPFSPQAADANLNGAVSVGDVVTILGMTR